MFFCVLFIRATFLCIVTCSVFWLFWLSFQYLSSDWLERLLRGSLIVAYIHMHSRYMSLFGKGIVSTKPRPKRLFRFSVSFHCLIVYFCPPALHNMFHTPMVQYSLFVLKVPLNANQPTNLSHGKTCTYIRDQSLLCAE